MSLTPAEEIRHLRREHAQVDYPVACCRKDHQNWPCDTVRALEAAAKAAAGALTIATDALLRLSLNDEMAGMGQRDDDPEATARCRYARRALDAVMAKVPAGGRDTADRPRP